MDLPQQGVGLLAGSGFTVKALTDSSRLLQVLEATVTCRPLLAVNVGSSISRFTVADALRPLDLDVGPHIKLNDS